METLESPEEKPPLSNRARRWLLTGALATGLAIGGAAVANAQTSDTTTPDSTTPDTTQVAPDSTTPNGNTAPESATPPEGCPDGQMGGPGMRGAPPGSENTAPQTETEGSSTAI